MNYIYFRCSTDKQDVAQQKQTVLEYLNRSNIEAYKTFEEKISGSVNHRERLLNELINICVNGDSIYISELSRLGRNMNDLFNIINDCTNKGVRIIQCKDGTLIENDSIGGKALLFALSLAAEIELKNIRQRTKSGLNARVTSGKEIGGTRDLWGKTKDVSDKDWYREQCLTNARDESAKIRLDKARSNTNNVEFRNFLDMWLKFNSEPRTSEDWQIMVAELNKQGRKTSTGMDFTVPRARSMYNKIKSIY